MSTFVPTDPHDLSPALLTSMISELRPGVEVDSVEVVKIFEYGEGRSGSGKQAKLAVTYAKKATPLPTSLIAKMSPPDDIWIANVDSLFKNEVQFYARVRPRLEIEAPLPMGGRFDEASRHYVLLMEDLEPKGTHFNTIADGVCPIPKLQGILDTVAKMHASLWDSPLFATELSCVKTQTEGTNEELVDGLIRDVRKQELKSVAFKQEIVEQLGTTEHVLHHGIKAMKRHQARLPRTLLHGDLHFNNTYTLPNGTGGLYDWQWSCRGFPSHDINSLITTSLSIGQRRKHERELLDFYLDRLRSYGAATAPDRETLWREYRRASFHSLVIGWLPAPMASYGWPLSVLAHQRTAAACLDHDTVKLIEELL